jgi:molybdenum cofactor guanylyltransferase
VLRSLADSGADLALPVARGHRQPLAAGYRTSLTRVIDELLTWSELRLGMLAEHCRVARLDEAALLADAELARLDPELDSLVNVNTPEEYDEAHARPAPEVRLCWPSGVRGPATVRAASLGAAADAAGAGSGVPVRAEIDGRREPRTPLAAGDAVRLHPA